MYFNTYIYTYVLYIYIYIYIYFTKNRHVMFTSRYLKHVQHTLNMLRLETIRQTTS